MNDEVILIIALLFFIALSVKNKTKAVASLQENKRLPSEI